MIGVASLLIVVLFYNLFVCFWCLERGLLLRLIRLVFSYRPRVVTFLQLDLCLSLARLYFILVMLLFIPLNLKSSASFVAERTLQDCFDSSTESLCHSSLWIVSECVIHCCMVSPRLFDSSVELVLIRVAPRSGYSILISRRWMSFFLNGSKN